LIFYDEHWNQRQKIPGCKPASQKYLKSEIHWDPHDTRSVAIAAKDTISLYDTRKALKSTSIPASEQLYDILAFSFNPNLPHRLVSAGTDGVLLFFDIRNPNTPLLKSKQTHEHWIWSVEYNKFHDELVLSGGGDGQVVLSDMTSVSSSASLRSKANRQIPTANDNHHESVYQVAWSWSDPWIWASVSFEGNLVVQLVPSETKYGLLLDVED